jgi:hypothetical protein
MKDIYSGRLPEALKPDLIIGAIRSLWTSRRSYRALREWARRMQSAFQALSTDGLPLLVRPLLVRIEPYRVKLRV